MTETDAVAAGRGQERHIRRNPASNITSDAIVITVANRSVRDGMVVMGHTLRMPPATLTWTLLLIVSACGGTTETSAGAGGSGNALQSGGSASLAGAAQTGGNASLAGTTSLGGSAGIGGESGGGNTTASGGPNSTASCTSASDCALSQGCCGCTAYAIREGIADCAMACTQTVCELLGISADEVNCVAGRCVIARSCAGMVTCQSPPPPCGPIGQPSVDGSCYGPCLPVDQCSAVDSCSICTMYGLACVTEESLGGPAYHCVSTPPACAQNPTCQCMGVCSGAFQCSQPNSTNLYCICPTC
jgi:hypothetical protein